MDVTLNMAASLDGRVSGPKGEPLTLSGPEDLLRVHRLRASVDGVLVGIGTVLADDPLLTARCEPPPGRQPTRVVLDPRLRTPPGARVLDDAAPSLLVAGTGAPERSDRAEVLVLPGPRPRPGDVLQALEARGFGRVLLEGGPTVAAAFLAAGAVDRFHLYLAPRVLGAGVSLAEALAVAPVRLRTRSVVPLGEGALLSYGVEG